MSACQTPPESLGDRKKAPKPRAPLSSRARAERESASMEDVRDVGGPSAELRRMVRHGRREQLSNCQLVKITAGHRAAKVADRRR